jgi:hypothetical protein
MLVSLMALFIRLIIRLFQLVFSVGTVFFSHIKSANSVFQPAYEHSRTGSISWDLARISSHLILSYLISYLIIIIIIKKSKEWTPFWCGIPTLCLLRSRTPRLHPSLATNLAPLISKGRKQTVRPSRSLPLRLPHATCKEIHGQQGNSNHQSRNNRMSSSIGKKSITLTNRGAVPWQKLTLRSPRAAS